MKLAEHIATAAAFVAAVLLRAWVLTVLWGWYAVPAFGLPGLSTLHAFGVSLIVAFLTYQPQLDDKRSPARKLGDSITISLMTLCAGWVGTWFA